MKNTVLDMDVTYSLNNNDNYLKSLPNKYDALRKLSYILCEYIKTILENKKVKKSKSELFVITRGLETLINVYLILLYHTNNADLAIYHTHRSFIFYLEFVEQITEDQHTFLQLTSRDASMYVYKKTIFEVKREIIQNVDNQEFSYINKASQLLKLISTTLLMHHNNGNKIDVENIKKVFEKMTKNKYSFEKIDNVMFLISSINFDCDVIEELLKILNKNSKSL